MFIDYLPLMLTNMVAALVTLACFLLKGIESENTQKWAPPFAISGLVATVCGFVMTFTWPLPKPYNIPFGELSVLFGVLFLGAAWALANKWDLLPLGVYAFFAGAAAILLGIRIMDLALTKTPLLTCIGFILTGSAGIFSGLTLCMVKIKAFRVIGALVLLAAAAIWELTALMGYWAHMFVE